MNNENSYEQIFFKDVLGEYLDTLFEYLKYLLKNHSEDEAYDIIKKSILNSFKCNDLDIGYISGSSMVMKSWLYDDLKKKD